MLETCVFTLRFQRYLIFKNPFGENDIRYNTLNLSQQCYSFANSTVSPRSRNISGNIRLYILQFIHFVPKIRTKQTEKLA